MTLLAIELSALENLKALFPSEAEWRHFIGQSQQLENASVWLPLLDACIPLLAAKCGLDAVQKVYSSRLKFAVQQHISGQSENELELLAFEVFCLSKLAQVSEEFALLESQPLKGQPTPDAAFRLAGHECRVEIRAPSHPATRKSCWSSNLEGLSYRLRESLCEVPSKFASSPETVNLVLVSHLAAPCLGVSVIPALYGSSFLYPDHDPLSLVREFSVPMPKDLDEDALFAQKDWQVVSGVGWITYQALPESVHSFGFVFPNPKAFRPIPTCIAIALHQALNLHLFPATKFERLRFAQQLLPRLNEVLRKQFGAKKVVPFGSVRETAFWHRYSDIDLAVNGIDETKLADVEAALFEVSPWAIPVHLVPLSDIPKRVLKRLSGGRTRMSDWCKEVLEDLAELEELLQTMQSYCAGKDPSTDLSAKTVAAKTLHDFYETAERILRRIVTVFDGDLPKGPDRHKQLLEQAAKPTDKRTPVVSEELMAALDEYRQFRHLFRAIYFFKLGYGRMKPLAERLPEVVKRLCSELEDFLKRHGKTETAAKGE